MSQMGIYEDYIANTTIVPNLTKLWDMEESEVKLFLTGGLIAVIVTIFALSLVFTPLRFLLKMQGFAWTISAYIMILIVNNLCQQSHHGKGFLVVTPQEN